MSEALRNNTGEQTSETKQTTEWDSLSNPNESWEEHLKNVDDLLARTEESESEGIHLGKFNLKINPSIEMGSDGIKVTDEDLSLSTVERIDDTDQICLVHSTDFFPENNTILSNVDGGKICPKVEFEDTNLVVVTDNYNPRETIHFTINGRVQDTGDGAGSWGNQKFIIIEPLSNHQDELVSGEPHSGDNFVNGSMKLSRDAILMVRDDVFDELSEEQKRQYNIVKYSGDASACTKNLIHALGMPVVDNNANDGTHGHSEYAHQEEMLEHRASNIRRIAGAVLSKTKGANFLSKEDIGMLYKMAPSDYEYYDSNSPDLKSARLLANNLGVTERVADFILKNGVYRDPSGYAMLSNDMTKEHQNDPEWYIESAKNGYGFGELQQFIDNNSLESYIDSSPLEKNNKFNNISIGQLQSFRNINTLKKLKNSIGMAEDEMLILRGDGIYLAKGETSYKDIQNRTDKEIMLGTNADTIHDVIYKYKTLV